MDIMKYDKRVIFPRGKQKEFLDIARDHLGCSWVQLSEILGIHNRTLTDWKREKYSISLSAFNNLSQFAPLKYKKNLQIKDSFWYCSKGSNSGYKKVIEKYGYVGGDPEYRKMKRKEWWDNTGKYQKGVIGSVKSIRIPRKSKKLAEFVGIVMGDGSLTKNQLQITLNSKDDKEYADFVRELINDLFDVRPSVYYEKDAMAMKLIVSRKKLVDFCKQELGLIIGNKIKQGLDIPKWVKLNKEFNISCIRGLVDTDGCVFTEKHYVKGRVYCYKRLNFTSKSLKLRKSVFFILEELGLEPKFRNDRSVQIEKKNNIEEYFKVINTNNPKHRIRFMEGSHSGLVHRS